jgi:hypothetical protein
MFLADHIAPCGINCATCLGFLRNKNKCDGCNMESSNRRNYCITCKIKNCQYLSYTASKLCGDCEKFPCTRLKQLDKRYRTKYNSYLIENLKRIKSSGMQEYLKSEELKWVCNNCGGTICVHRGICLSCNNK